MSSLLPDKRQATYTRMCELVKTFIANLNPEVVITDFEKAAISAFSNAFPSVRMSGYMFHLAKNVQRHIDSIGLRESYAANNTVKKFVMGLKCLAFIKPDEVEIVF